MSSSTIAAAPTDSGSSSRSSSAPSESNSDTATLYLFTFLATILILVLLSASLVLRSYVLRRRYRQRFQQALADGLFVDFDRSVFNGAGEFDPLGGFRRSTRRLGPCPILWDTWIHPAEIRKDGDTLSSIIPVAVRCTPSTSTLSPLSPSMPGSPSSLPSQPRPVFLSQLRLSSPFTHSPRSSSQASAQPRSPIGFPAISSTRLPPPTAPTSPDPNSSVEQDAATLQVCVLVAMPAASTTANRPVSSAKGKGVDPLEFQAHQQSGDVDPLLPSPLHRSSAHIPHYPGDNEGFPLLEFGVVEVRMGKSAWDAVIL